MRSITVSNLCNLLLVSDKNSIEELSKEDIKQLKYEQIAENDVWKVKMINEITDIKFQKLEVENFSIEELDEILFHLCTD